MAGKKHHVEFTATKTVMEPTPVAFTTKIGESVHFTAKKPVQEKVDVSFMAGTKK
jgi:hypothetical protein